MRYERAQNAAARALRHDEAFGGCFACFAQALAGDDEKAAMILRVAAPDEIQKRRVSAILREAVEIEHGIRRDAAAAQTFRCAAVDTRHRLTRHERRRQALERFGRRLRFCLRRWAMKRLRRFRRFALRLCFSARLRLCFAARGLHRPAPAARYDEVTHPGRSARLTREAGAGGGTGMIGEMRVDLAIIILKPANEAGLLNFS
jgi:hypothetical protein